MQTKDLLRAADILISGDLQAVFDSIFHNIPIKIPAVQTFATCIITRPPPFFTPALLHLCRHQFEHSCLSSFFFVLAPLDIYTFIYVQVLHLPDCTACNTVYCTFKKLLWNVFFCALNGQHLCCDGFDYSAKTKYESIHNIYSIKPFLWKIYTEKKKKLVICLVAEGADLHRAQMFPKV